MIVPGGLATLKVLILLPFISHSLELVMHVALGTQRLAHSLIASIAFTEISTLLNLYAMLRGILLVGSGASSITTDLKQVLRWMAGFILSGPAAILRVLSRLQQM